jgi:hypothetical protein
MRRFIGEEPINIPLGFQRRGFDETKHALRLTINVLAIPCAEPCSPGAQIRMRLISACE